MEFSEIEKYGVEKQFDSYCRKILHRKACNCFSDLLNKTKHEKSLGDLSAAEMGQLVTNDTYPSFYTLFHVSGFETDILVANEELANEKFVWAAQKAMIVFEPIIKEMGIDKDTKTLEETLNGELKKAVRTMEMIKKKFIGGLSKPLESQFNRILEALTAFTKKDKDDVLYVGMDEKQQPMLCVESSDTSEQMKRVLWKMRTPILLTSGTLSVGKDFSYFNPWGRIFPISSSRQEWTRINGSGRRSSPLPFCTRRIACYICRVQPYITRVMMSHGIMRKQREKLRNS